MDSIRFRTSALIALVAMTTNGCAALSLFSSTHEHHYDSNPEIERRLTALEQRFSAFEQGHTAAGPAVLSGSGAATSEDAIQQSDFAQPATETGASETRGSKPSPGVKSTSRKSAGGSASSTDPTSPDSKSN
jgi:hypothetical protein